MNLENIADFEKEWFCDFFSCRWIANRKISKFRNQQCCFICSTRHRRWLPGRYKRHAGFLC